ncbi:unnamed protein product [Cladocopium goreaui]|uniref:Uncharacterized protein n=1 Tax=Cladocopium goreaui TaxID=2562237 RepID=A0A9P1CMN2_9DINO|nr:unnamed protein product [Cladocopium goreaui]
MTEITGPGTQVCCRKANLPAVPSARHVALSASIPAPDAKGKTAGLAVLVSQIGYCYRRRRRISVFQQAKPPLPPGGSAARKKFAQIPLPQMPSGPAEVVEIDAAEGIVLPPFNRVPKTGGENGDVNGLSVSPPSQTLQDAPERPPLPPVPKTGGDNGGVNGLSVSPPSQSLQDAPERPPLPPLPKTAGDNGGVNDVAHKICPTDMGLMQALLYLTVWPGSCLLFTHRWSGCAGAPSVASTSQDGW